ncbi:MAG: AAA family ATPase [Firmicutes bacterium]|jgi:predicted ATPase|nr:AAA family ATPase [Bacillota bacterium]
MDKYYIKHIRMDSCKDSTYISRLPVVKHLNSIEELSFENQVTFIVGENGSGKSTLLEAIAVKAGYNGEGGSKNFNFSTKETISNLESYITLARSSHEKDGFFLRAESFYNVASQVDDLGLNLDGYGGKSLHEQSHGESFLSLISNRFRGNGLYLLDEPESALSPLRQLTLLAEINRLVKKNSQLIIATHSPILLAYPNAIIYQISEEGIEQVEYKESDNYILTKQFLDKPEDFIRHLFK